MKPTSRSIESILAAAVELDSEAGRRAFVEQACAGDGEFKRRVEELMENHFRAGSFLESPVAGLSAGEDSLTERPGTAIGPYKLLEQIGEGGFGVVFMAEQQQPVRRKVGLKIVKPGMDTRQVVVRFEAKRQSLALMDHPHIARVFDGGETASGRPYFVMELIRGIPITQFCDDNRLTARERLELFLAVCQAVQHAHQKGIIHRDLKPSNVLVTLQDEGTPLVKVIDFGIAKALGQERLTEKTLCTGFAQMLGTPLYMSPEQAQMGGQDADTRTDIYALGVLLYELLTGTTPFDKERLKEASYEEIRRIIREEEPVKPSRRLSTLGQAATTVSANRWSEPRRLSQLFRGELDWIVMKALEKDRNFRYEAASSLAADVERYLHDEPVQACPPSAAYRFRKFARRNKIGLAVRSLAFSPDGRHLASAGDDATVRIWEFEPGRVEPATSPTRTLASDNGLHHHVAFSSDGGLILFGGGGVNSGGHVNICDTRTWRPLSLLEFDRNPSTGSPLAFSPYGAYLAAGSANFAIEVRNAANGREIHRLEGHRWTLNDVTFGPNPEIPILASASSDRTIRIWDVKTGKQIKSLHHTNNALCVTFSRDGQLLASGGQDRVIKLWDGRSWKLIDVWPDANGSVNSMMFHPQDSHLLAWGSTDGTVKVWSRATREIRTLRGHTSWVEGVAFSPDGKWIASASLHKTIKVWGVPQFLKGSDQAVGVTDD